MHIVSAHENQSIYSIDLFVSIWSRDPARRKECELLKFIEHAFRRDSYGMMNKIGSNTKKEINSRNWTKWLFWVPGMLVPTMKLPSWSIFYISLVIDRLFILSLNEQQNPMQIWMWKLSMRSNRGFKSRHRLFNLSLFFSFSAFFVHSMQFIFEM